MRILIIEDEPMLRTLLQQNLHDAGYAVDACENGIDGHHSGANANYDAIVLDLGLPGLDGLSVLRRWREASLTTPVLILTARDDWSEKVAGIDAGADDYLTKPFRMEELLARLRALIRRSQGQANAVLRNGRLALDTNRARLSVDGQAITLTSHEYRVLDHLMHRVDQVVSRCELIEHIYAQEFDRDSNTIEVFIARLRKKLPAGAIETVRGLGYRMPRREP